MVSGFTKFKERFQGFENQYVIIGGTACDLIMENEELPFRATKDVDIDMKKFLSEIADEKVDLKSLGIRGTDKKKMTEILYQCYGLKVLLNTGEDNDVYKDL